MLEHGPAVRDGHADAIPAAVENVVEKAASNEVTSQQDIVETERVERIREAYAAYREMSVEEHKSRGDQFREATTVTGFKMEIKRHGLAKSQALRAALPSGSLASSGGLPQPRRRQGPIMAAVSDPLGDHASIGSPLGLRCLYL